MLNPYFRSSRMSADEFRELVEDFCANCTATEVARRLGRQRNTINTIFNKIRRRIANTLERESLFSGINEDGKYIASYRGVDFIRGAKAVGALEATVIGVFQRPTPFRPMEWIDSVKVLTEVLPDMEPETLQRLHGGLCPLVQVFTYENLLGGFTYTYRRIGVANETDTFYGFFGRRMQSFHGVPPQTRYLHLKENEWRFNSRATNRAARLLQLLAANPL
jgi:transposase-like protein